MKNHSEDSSHQLTNSYEASKHKLLRQAHGTGRANIHYDTWHVYNCSFTSISKHSDFLNRSNTYERKWSCSQNMYTDIFAAVLMAEITATIISVEH